MWFSHWNLQTDNDNLITEESTKTGVTPTLSMDFTNNHLDLCTETEARKGLLPTRADESCQLKQQGKQKIGQSHSS